MPYLGGTLRIDPTLVGMAYDREEEKSADGFPYDRDDDGGFDTVQRFAGARIDRGSGNREPLRGYLTPSDIDRTDYSGFEEALGTPFNVSLGMKPGMTSQTGIPGTSGLKSWASSFVRDEDEDVYERKLTDMFPDIDHSFESDIVTTVGSGFGSGLGKTNPSGRGFMLGWTEEKEPKSSWDIALDLIRNIMKNNKNDLIKLNNDKDE